MQDSGTKPAQSIDHGDFEGIISRAGLDADSSTDSHRRRDGLSSDVPGEIRLMTAILTDAMRSYLRTRSARSANGRIEFAELEAWFNAGNQRSLFAFENVCSVLAISADAVRRELRTAAPRGLSSSVRLRLRPYSRRTRRPRDRENGRYHNESDVSRRKNGAGTKPVRD